MMVRILPMLLLWIGTVATTSHAGPEFLQGADPRVGHALAALNEGLVDERVASLLSDGARAYGEADFAAAARLYDEAAALAPKSEDIRAMAKVASAMVAAREEALTSMPSDPARRAEFAAAAADQAAAFLAAGEAEKAYEGYFRLWVSGASTSDLAPRMQEALAVANVPSRSARVVAGAAVSKAQIDEMLVEAQFALNSGDIEAARAVYERVAAVDPKNKVVEYQLSKLPAPAAAPAANPFKEAAPVAPPVVLAAAPAETAKPAAEAPVSKIDRLVAEAEAFLAEGRFDDAQAAYRKILSLESGNARALSGLENVVAERLRSVQAESAAPASAIVAASAPVKSELDLAREDVAKGDLLAARSRLEAILRADPANLVAVDELKRVVRLEGEKLAAAAPITDLQPIDAAAAPAEPVSYEIAQAAEATAEDMEFELDPDDPPMEVQSADPAASAPREAGVPAPADPAAAAAAAEPMAAPAMGERELTVELDRLHREALAMYRENDIPGARANWEQMEKLNPGDRRATTFLAETADEFQRHNEDMAARAAADENRRIASELLNSPVTISTDRATPLTEFMRIISFSTVTELEYYIADGANAEVYANFVDKPLRDVLDAVLKPIGLSWEIDARNLITIRPELFTRTFNLSTDQLNKVRSLLDSGDLQRVIWGQDTPPSKGVEMTIDERQRVFLIVGSQLHIRKIDDFMATLDTGDNPDLEMRVYKIRESDGPKIKALINALIASDPSTPFTQERKIYIDGSDLIVRDTPENIIKIEELLLDEKFIEELRDEKLDIANFSLVPRDVENQGSDQISVFTNRIVESIETFLYARTGKRAAEAEGRRLWFDPATFQLTVVDTPTRIAEVGKFIESLPELRQRRLQKVIFLEHAVAEEMASQLAEVLGLSETGGTGGAGGEQTILKLRRGEEATFRELRIRVVRVEEGDPNDRNDDEVEVSLITGTQQSNLTLRELDTVFFEDYELSAQDVQPSGGGAQSTNRGEGTARILIRYNEPVEDAAPLAEAEPVAAAEEEEEDLTISPFGALNALIVRYDNPARLEEVEDLIVQLDKPTKQVEVETKFVQVNETRAREFSADFSIDGLGNGRSLDTDLWRLNSRFAQFADEARDTAEPPIENPLAANLLRGTTVLGLVLGDDPGVSFQLRLLEAEGVINITNGPKVTMLDAITGQFRIEKIGPANPFVSRQQGITGGFAQQGGGGDQYTLQEEDSSSFNSRLTSVVLEVTPEITSEKSIIFQIIAELVDFDSNVGEVVIPQFATGTPEEPTILPSSIDPNPTNSLLAPANLTTPAGFAQYILTRGNLFRTRKLIDTTARTHDGGTIVLGGWTGERAQDLTSGVPVLRNMPYVGKLFFSRNQRSLDRVTLLIFLTANLVD